MSWELKIVKPDSLLEAEPLLDPSLCLDPLLVEDRLPVFPVLFPVCRERVVPLREFVSDPLSSSDLPVGIGIGTGTTAATPPRPFLPLLLFSFAARTA